MYTVQVKKVQGSSLSKSSADLILAAMKAWGLLTMIRQNLNAVRKASVENDSQLWPIYDAMVHMYIPFFYQYKCILTDVKSCARQIDLQSTALFPRGYLTQAQSPNVSLNKCSVRWWFCNIIYPITTIWLQINMDVRCRYEAIIHQVLENFRIVSKLSLKPIMLLVPITIKVHVESHAQDVHCEPMLWGKVNTFLGSYVCLIDSKRW